MNTQLEEGQVFHTMNIRVTEQEWLVLQKHAVECGFKTKVLAQAVIKRYIKNLRSGDSDVSRETLSVI